MLATKNVWECINLIIIKNFNQLQLILKSFTMISYHKPIKLLINLSFSICLSLFLVLELLLQKITKKTEKCNILEENPYIWLKESLKKNILYLQCRKISEKDRKSFSKFVKMSKFINFWKVFISVNLDIFIVYFQLKINM